MDMDPVPRDNSRNISDDDLCSSCRFCDYRIGERSFCAKDWPCSLNEDGYVVSCGGYEQPKKEE